MVRPRCDLFCRVPVAKLADKEVEVAVKKAVEKAARESYGKLLAWLSWQWRDVAAAEDALATALTKALQVWPISGVPQAPESWLLTVAKRELLQVARRHRLHESPQVQALLTDSEQIADDPAAAKPLPDSRLKLLFVCAHPAIDRAIRPALMLQTVLGFEAAEIAQAMLISPAAMAQRLVRAKQKIRDTALRFEEPELDDLPDRLSTVLEAIYAAYGLAWDGIDGSEAAKIVDWRDEAIFLATLLCDLLTENVRQSRYPEQVLAEPYGMLALMLLCEARQSARRGDRGQFVPLGEQDTALWNHELLLRVDTLLAYSARLRALGPYQIEAAIQAAHTSRISTGFTPWPEIVKLYEALVLLAPTIGSRIAHAAALAQSGQSAVALMQLQAIPPQSISEYQPYWVALAYVQRLMGDLSAAEQSLMRAVGLTSSPSLREFLLKQ